jgi:nitronate monooxygenase
MKASALRDFAEKVRTATKKPFAMNLFIPTEEPKINKEAIHRAIQETEKYRNELKLLPPTLQPPFEENFEEQFENVLRLKPKVFSFVFGILKPEYVQAAKKEKIFLIGTATTLEEALALQDSGVDGITLQGFEAGGHRGIFDAEADDSEVHLDELLELCRLKIQLPLIAAGGLMTAKDIQKAISKGAQAVQMGTAFLACREAGTSNPYRHELTKSSIRKTKTTRAFSGRWARGIENRFMLEMDAKPEAILPFPAQNKFTRDLRSASAEKGSSDFLSLWSGAGNGELWTESAADLIYYLFEI